MILTSGTVANVWLVNQLLDRHNVLGMVIESRPLALTTKEKRGRRRQFLKRYGLLRTLNRLLYNWVQSRIIGNAGQAALKAHFFPGESPVTYSRAVPTLIVPNINDSKCIDFVQRHAPDVLAVCGTSVIRAEVFSLARLGTVNIHTGITPEYRSADPIFWALYNNEPEKVGVTIHFVDRGIDTGPIIHQDRIPVYAGDSLTTIYARCLRRGADLYLQALGEIEHGTVRTIDRPGVTNKAFFSIDLGIVQYLRFHFRFRRLTSRLPIEGAGQSPQAPEDRG